MKKVLYVATIDAHIKAFHIPYLKMLKNNGYEVHVATNGDEKIPYCDVKHQICIERSPLKLKNLKAIKQLKEIIEKEKFDIIHCHTPMGSVVARIAAKLAKKINVKVFYTSHGFHFYNGAPLKNWFFFFPIEWYLSKYTDTLITINTEDFEIAKKYFSKRCLDIKYIPGIGIEPKKFDFDITNKEKEKLRNSIGLKKEDYVLIFPARLDRNKNQILLIETMRKLIKVDKNIHLLLPGKDELNGFYQKITNNYGLNNNIHFLGFRDDIPKLLKISNLALSSSIREGFGINLIEALYCDIPVIATNNRGHRDIIKNGENGFLVNASLEEFYKKILEVRNYKFTALKDSTAPFLLKNVEKIMENIYFS